MKTLIFEGYSDGTFGEYGVTNNDVDNCASMMPIQCLITAATESMVVVGVYSIHPTDACWVIGIGQSAEDVPLPDWNVRFKADKGYSPKLEIDVPDDFKLLWYNDGEEVG